MTKTIKYYTLYAMNLHDDETEYHQVFGSYSRKEVLSEKEFAYTNCGYKTKIEITLEPRESASNNFIRGIK